MKYYFKRQRSTTSMKNEIMQLRLYGKLRKAQAAV